MKNTYPTTTAGVVNADQPGRLAVVFARETVRAEIYQASGMIATQLSIPVSDALLRIRAHPFAQGQTTETEV